MKHVKRTSQYSKGLVALLTTGFIYGTFGPIFKTLNKTFSPYEITLYQNILGLFVSFIVLLIRREKPTFLKIPLPNMIGYAVFFPLAAISFSLACVYTKVTTATFMFYASSFIASYLASILLFKEGSSLYKNIAFVLSLVGLTVYAFPIEFGSNLVGLTLALASGVLGVVSSSYRKTISKYGSDYSLLPLPLIASVILSFILLMIFPADSIKLVQAFSAINLIFLLIMGLRIVLINWLTIYGFARIDLNIGTLLLSSDLLFTTLLSILFLSEIPLPKEIVGALCIALSIIIANWPRKANHHAEN